MDIKLDPISFNQTIKSYTVALPDIKALYDLMDVVYDTLPIPSILMDRSTKQAFHRMVYDTIHDIEAQTAYLQCVLAGGGINMIKSWIETKHEARYITNFQYGPCDISIRQGQVTKEYIVVLAYASDTKGTHPAIIDQIKQLPKDGVLGVHLDLTLHAKDIDEIILEVPKDSTHTERSDSDPDDVVVSNPDA